MLRVDLISAFTKNCKHCMLQTVAGHRTACWPLQAALQQCRSFAVLSAAVAVLLLLSSWVSEQCVQCLLLLLLLLLALLLASLCALRLREALLELAAAGANSAIAAAAAAGAGKVSASTTASSVLSVAAAAATVSGWSH
jgi:hypothetical protein